MGRSYEDGMKVIKGMAVTDLTSGDANGDWASMENYDSATLLIALGDGTANEDPVITIRQATSAAGAGAKTIASAVIYGHVAAAEATVTGDVMALLSSDGDYTNSGEEAALLRCEVLADELDVSGGFKYIGFSASDPGNSGTKNCSAIYVLQGARHIVDVPDQPRVTT